MPNGRGEVRVVLPASFEMVEGREMRTTALPRGPVPIATVRPSDEEAAVTAGLQRGEWQVVREFHAAPASDAARRGLRAPEELNPAIEISLDVDADERAVVLLEQDGVYSWKTEPDTVSTPPTARRGTPASRTVTFRVPVHPNTTQDMKTRSLASVLFAPVRALVLKYAAHLVAGALVKHLEANIHRGLVHMQGPRADQWADIGDLQSIGLDQKAAPRLLLFIHGTFSSTRGSFGALSEFPWGQAFLQAALANYDAVIGFDHATLSEDPKENAAALLKALQQVQWKQPPRVDVVTYSRGGLLYRALVELLLPSNPLKVRFERSVFVGVPNAGTHLADPANWRDLVDLYTNLSAAVFRVIGIAAPASATATAILSEAISLIGNLVKYLASAAASGDDVPGLASMNPDGPFIDTINQDNAGQPAIGSTYYCYITSNFESKSSNHPPAEIPPRLMLKLADGFIDRLLKSETNDLVVDTKSVPAIDPAVGHFMKDWFDFGENSFVYHTNYFTRPEVANALTRWLRLPQPAQASVPAAAGSVVAPDLPAAVDTDILVANSREMASDVLQRIERESPSYLVVQRPYDTELFHYAFPAEDVLPRLTRTDITVERALDLHERDRSREVSSAESVQFGYADEPQKRTVVVDDGKPLGVVGGPVTHEGLDVTTLAGVVRNPRSAADRMLYRRAMPTHARPVAAAAPRPAAPPAEAETYHFLAQMDNPVELGQKKSVEVTISRAEVAARAEAAAAAGSTPLQRDRKLIVQVIPRKNFHVDGDDRQELEVDKIGESQLVLFDVTPTAAGDGELWVVARQGQVSLLTLKLKVRIEQKLASDRTLSPVVAEASVAPAAPTRPFQKLTIWELTNGNATSLRFELEAPQLGLYKYYDSPPIVGSREEYVRNLYQELENYWGQNADDARNFLADLRSYGMQLFDQLVPRDLQKDLWDHRNDLKSIMVVSTEPFIPWELVHLHEPGKGLPDDNRFFGQMGVVRWLHGNWPPDRLKIRRGKRRYVIPDYPVAKYKLKDAAAEEQFMISEMKADAVTPQLQNVRDLLSQPGGFDLLHFACHGGNDPDAADAQLLLEGRLENGNYYPALFNSAVVTAYGRFGEDGTHPLVVLNACQVGENRKKLTSFGGFAEAFLSRGAGVFVAPLWSVGDLEAYLFGREFYKELKQGKTVSEAAVAARESARVQGGGDATWIAYAVYGHPHAVMEDL